MIIAALLGALTFGACVDSTESASVTAIRNAKAEQLKSIATLNNAKAQAEATLAAAEAQIAAAQAALIQAQAAALNATTEEQKIANQLAAAQAEAEIAKIEAQLELDLLKYQTDLMNAQVKFAEENDKHIAALYAAYTQDLADLKEAQTILATANATLVKAEKGLASVEETFNKSLTKAQNELAKLQSKKAAKEAEIEALRAAAYYGISQGEALAAAEDAVELKDKLFGELTVLEAALWRAYEKEAALKTAHTAEKYYTSMLVFQSKSTLAGKDFKTNDEVSANDAWGFYNVILNSTANQYQKSNKDADLVALFDLTAVDADDAKIRTAFYGINAEAIEVYEEALTNLLSTSDQAVELAKAVFKYEAYLDTTDVEELDELYNDYIAEKKELNAEIAEYQAEIDLIELEMYIYEKADKKYYAEEIADLQKEKDALKADIADVEKEIKDLDTAYDKAAAEYKDADLSTYEDLADDVVAKTRAFDTVAKAYAKEVETLKEIASLSDAFVATYVAEYNAAVAAVAAAEEAYLAKHKEWNEADALWKLYISIYYHYTPYPDGTADPTYKVSDHYVSLLLDEALAALEEIEDAIEAKEGDIEDMSLAAETATKEQAVAVAQAAVVDAEYQVAIAEANLAVTKAALDAAIAE